MKAEKYKRLYIKEIYSASEECSIDTRMNELVLEWVDKFVKLYPSLEYRIINAETQMINASTWAGQTLPPTIRYIVHIAYSF